MHPDIRTALPAMVRAFWTFPETVHLLPDEAKRRRVLPRYLAADMTDARRFGGLNVAERDGKPVAAAAWLPPGAYPIGFARELRGLVTLAPALPWGASAAREGRRGQTANRTAHRVYAEPHFFLRTIGVDPAYQRHGIGKELLAPMLAAADAQHVGCFLVPATADNAAWYRRLGFTDERRYHPTPTWPEVWALWRPPR
ncbi:MAG TPA: GNAT family N-acetyltransferase [Acidimicrobiales bacterium]|nr:GNAT family N-acetyltransferase [Acidimicrobiales bacterium]